MSIKERLYPTAEQVVALTRHCGQARFVWNLALEQRQMWSSYDQSNKPRFNFATQARELAAARKETWLGTGSSAIQQAALRDLDQAFTHFFKGTHKYPTWRKVGLHEAFKVRDLTVRRVTRRWGEVLVPKVGWVRFRISRPFAEIVGGSSARVSFKAGRWHVAFVTKPGPFERETTGKSVGIDRGVANTIATSDATFEHIVSLSKDEKRRFKLLEQKMARQQQASNRRAVTRLELAKLNDRLVRRRKDWVEKTSTRLVRGNDLIVFEALVVKNMVRAPKPKPDPDNVGQFLPNGKAAKSGLNRVIHASCWGSLLQRTQQKAALATAPCEVVLVDPKFTSQMCRSCGNVAPENRENQADFRCITCGHTAHADTNAAENILARGRNLPSGAIREDISRMDAPALRATASKQPQFP